MVNGKEPFKLCICPQHLREIIQTHEKDKKVLKFPQNVLDQPTFDKIPAPCFTLKELNEFYFENLGCLRLSSKIQNLQNLTYLSLFKNNLTKIPESLSKITTLQRINIAHNRLCEMPELPKGLVDIDLSSNFITAIHHQLQDMKNLDRLLISSNEINDVWPEALSGNEKLTQIDLSRNELDKFPETITECPILEWLDISRNNIRSVQPWVGESNTLIKNLRALYISYNQLDLESVKIISKLKNLGSLNLSGNMLETLPEELGNLKFLQSIWLTNNGFKKFPEVLCQFRFVGCIDLCGNNISYIEDQNDNPNLDFSKLAKSLATFEMAGNRMICFPDVISEFKGLYRLNLSNNNAKNLTIKLATYFKKQFDLYGFIKEGKSASYEDGVALFGNRFDSELEDLVESQDGRLHDILEVVTEDPKFKDYREILENMTIPETESEDEEDLKRQIRWNAGAHENKV